MSYEPLPTFDLPHSTPIMVVKNSLYKDNRYQVTIKDTLTGVHIFGKSGSAKTSGSGKVFARGMLLNGYGGLVHTVKKSEIGSWMGYGDRIGEHTGHIKAAGRDAQAVVFGEGCPFTFNPFSYMKRFPKYYDVDFLLTLLLEIYRLAQGAKGRKPSSGGNSDFWDGMRDGAARAAIGLLMLADEEINPVVIKQVVDTMPITPEAAQEFIKKRETLDYEDFCAWLERKENFAFYCFEMGRMRDDLTENEKGILEDVEPYLMREFPTLGEKYHRTLKEALNIIVTPFKNRNGILYRYFMRGVSEELCPEKCYEDGAIIIIDFPTEIEEEAGTIIQNVYRMVWQKVMMMRNVQDSSKPNYNNRPVFFWMDECSKMVTPRDGDFFSKCREQMVASVLINQNMNSYFDKMQGINGAKYATENFLDNIGLHVVHQVDALTAEWASRQCGRRMVKRASTSISKDSGGVVRFNTSGQPIQPRESTSYSWQNESEVEAIKFMELQRGGKENGAITEAILLLNKPHKDKYHLRVEFFQGHLDDGVEEEPFGLNYPREEKGWLGTRIKEHPTPEERKSVGGFKYRGFVCGVEQI